MRIVDAHEDIAWNALNFGRDMLRSAWETRRLEEEAETPSRTGRCMLGLPEWLEGGIAVIFGTLFIAPAHRRLGKWDRQIYADADEAHDRASAQLDYYHRLAERSDRIELVGSQVELEEVLASWEDEEPRVGIVSLMEGADPIRRPDELELWHRRGVRLIGLAWGAGSRYAGGNAQPGPLTVEGRDLLEAMAEFSMILDLSHLAEEAFWEAVDRYEGPVVATHSNPRAFVPSARQLSDSMIRALVERDGVIGIVPWNRFLRPNLVSSDSKQAVSIQDVAMAVDHICQAAGDAAHVGLGSDFDGGLGAEATPEGMETVADLRKVSEALAERGYADADVAAVMGGNWLRVLRAALPSR
ncbi:MAG: membrane dipeptidase [Anaerolineae bacterium]|jgi:membrane dipeptidase